MAMCRNIAVRSAGWRYQHHGENGGVASAISSADMGHDRIDQVSWAVVEASVKVVMVNVCCVCTLCGSGNSGRNDAAAAISGAARSVSGVK